MKKSSSHFKKIFKLKFFTNLFINEKQKTYKKNEILEERENKLHTLGNLLEDIGVY